MIRVKIEVAINVNNAGDIMSETFGRFVNSSLRTFMETGFDGKVRLADPLNQVRMTKFEVTDDSEFGVVGRKDG